MVENQKRRKVKALRADNRGEYIFMEFKAYLPGKGIEYQLNISGRPKQNGVAERMIGHLQRMPTTSSYRLTCQKNLG